MLRRAGFDDVSDLLGGYQAWAAAQARAAVGP
jgi:rhodanese-related sulfurtransferase